MMTQKAMASSPTNGIPQLIALIKHQWEQTLNFIQFQPLIHKTIRSQTTYIDVKSFCESVITSVTK